MSIPLPPAQGGTLDTATMLQTDLKDGGGGFWRDVFRRLRAHDNYPLPELPSPLTRPAQLGLWLAETRNDLQPPAVKLVPIIGDIVAQLAQTQGCILARMSGSGATCFGLFGSTGQAHQAAQVMRAAHPDHWVAAAPLLLP